MPPRTRRASAATAEKSLVLGFVGMEDLDATIIEATLQDLVGTVEEGTTVTAVFPLVNDFVGDGLWVTFDQLAETEGLKLVVVTNQDGSDDDKEMHATASDPKLSAVIVPMGDDKPPVTVADELVKAKAAGADAKLLVFLVKEPAEGEEDPGAQYAAVEAAWGGGVEIFNIADAMDPIQLGDTNEAPAAEPEPPAAPPARRRRGAAAAEEKPAATEAPAEPAPPARRRRGAAAAEEAPADEAQQTLPIESAVAEGIMLTSDVLIDLLADLIATKVVEKLNSGGEDAPKRRARS